MAAIDWPPTLPVARRAGNSSTLKDSVIRSQMGYGPDKLRRRTTAQISNQPVTLILDDTEKATLDTFYFTTAQQVARFNYDDPYSGTNVEARFVTPPAYVEVNCSTWAVSFTLEMLP